MTARASVASASLFENLRARFQLPYGDTRFLSHRVHGRRRDETIGNVLTASGRQARRLDPAGLLVYTLVVWSFLEGYSRGSQRCALAPQKATLGGVGLHHHREFELVALGG